MTKITLSERKTDRLLNIKTTGIINSKEKDHFRYEPTPYKDLYLLFEKLKLKETDHFVDFGSGRGRVCFYVHYLFKSFVYGIEINLPTFHESLINLQNYNNKYNSNNKIAFINEYAENYEIKNFQNIFFFFNPFTVKIFKKVIYNIDDSLKKHPRDITIILTYPILEYVNFILQETDFIVKDYIEFNKHNKSLNKFIILKNI